MSGTAERTWEQRNAEDGAAVILLCAACGANVEELPPTGGATAGV